MFECRKTLYANSHILRELTLKRLTYFLSEDTKSISDAMATIEISIYNKVFSLYILTQRTLSLVDPLAL
jgi:hypothetical protein